MYEMNEEIAERIVQEYVFKMIYAENIRMAASAYLELTSCFSKRYLKEYFEKSFTIQGKKQAIKDLSILKAILEYLQKHQTANYEVIMGAERNQDQTISCYVGQKKELFPSEGSAEEMLLSFKKRRSWFRMINEAIQKEDRETLEANYFAIKNTPCLSWTISFFQLQLPETREGVYKRSNGNFSV